jgi:hypothetical protein
VNEGPGQDDIMRLARKFRTAIERSPRDDLLSFRRFPRGCCSDTAILLGEYLCGQGQGDWDYAGGEREPDLHSHAWLEQDGLIVDITADQFEDIHEPIIVTRDRSWHEQFVYPEPRHPARIGNYDPVTRNRLAMIYERILKEILRGG